LVIVKLQYKPHVAIFHMGQNTDWLLHSIPQTYTLYIFQWICANYITIGAQSWLNNEKIYIKHRVIIVFYKKIEKTMNII